MPSGSRYENDNGPNFIGIRADLPFWAGTACPLNPTTRFLGAEIEVGNHTSWDVAQKIEAAVEKWKALIHSDCAFEVCTAPASGHLWVEQVTEFCRLFKEGKITATQPTCGCHVHVDARDLSPEMVEGLLHLLIRVEPIVFAMVPIARRTNSYCNPSAPLFITWLDKLTKDPYLDRTQWLLECIFGRNLDGTLRFVKPKDMAGLKANKIKHCGNIPRYLAFNFQPYFGHGTIECRLLNGCTNPVRLINWGVMLASILDCAKNTRMKEITRLCKLSPLRLLMKMSPSLAHKRWITATLRTFSTVTPPTPEQLKGYTTARRRVDRAVQQHTASVLAGAAEGWGI